MNRLKRRQDELAIDTAELEARRNNLLQEVDKLEIRRVARESVLGGLDREIRRLKSRLKTLQDEVERREASQERPDIESQSGGSSERTIEDTSQSESTE